MATAIASQQIGKVVQVIGPVLDVAFESEQLPELYNALELDAKTEAGDPIRIVAEVQQHIGRNIVRAVAMSTTDGAIRGMEMVDTGAPISVPVGEATSPKTWMRPLRRNELTPWLVQSVSGKYPTYSESNETHHAPSEYWMPKLLALPAASVAPGFTVVLTCTKPQPL